MSGLASVLSGNGHRRVDIVAEIYDLEVKGPFERRGEGREDETEWNGKESCEKNGLLRCH